MKKVNPEDLVAGQEYYVKLKFGFKDKGLTPLCFTDILEDDYWYHKDQPIYTADNDRLKMVVEVATALLVNDTHYTENEIEGELGHKLSEDKKERVKQWASAYKKLIAREAADLIAACKQIKEGEK